MTYRFNHINRKSTLNHNKTQKESKCDWLSRHQLLCFIKKRENNQKTLTYNFHKNQMERNKHSKQECAWSIKIKISNFHNCICDSLFDKLLHLDDSRRLNKILCEVKAKRQKRPQKIKAQTTIRWPKRKDAFNVSGLYKCLSPEGLEKAMQISVQSSVLSRSRLFVCLFSVRRPSEGMHLYSCTLGANVQPRKLHKIINKYWPRSWKGKKKNRTY